MLTLIENEVIDATVKLIGWAAGGDGIFTPGGSMANMYGVNLARFNCDHTMKQKGLFGRKRLVIFTSDQVRFQCLLGRSEQELRIGLPL